MNGRDWITLAVSDEVADPDQRQQAGSRAGRLGAQPNKAVASQPSRSALQAHSGVEKLNKEITAGLADPKMKARLADLGATVLALSPADFGKLIAEDTEKWAKVVKFAGIKPE
jgi:hypothetical protein